MINVNKITKTYGSKTVLDNVSFLVKDGEIVGYVEPNGAGKTTTMKIIVGVWKLSSGDIEIDGHSITEEKAKREIGWVPEFPALDESEKAINYFILYSLLL
ncbi:MAG: ATP-binding cassette domain-containing protein [Sulfolobus sp.]